MLGVPPDRLGASVGGLLQACPLLQGEEASSGRPTALLRDAYLLETGEAAIRPSFRLESTYSRVAGREAPTARSLQESTEA